MTCISSLVSEADSASRVRISLNMAGLSGNCRARHTWNDWLAYWWLEQDVAQCKALRAHFSYIQCMRMYLISYLINMKKDNCICKKLLQD